MKDDDFTLVEFPDDKEIDTLFDGFPDALTDWDIDRLFDLDNNPDQTTTSVKSANVNAKVKEQT